MLIGLLDYAALGYSTFFLGFKHSPEWSYLWLYPAPRSVRGSFYLCFATYALLEFWPGDSQLLAGSPFHSKRHLAYSLALLFTAALGNLWDSFRMRSLSGQSSIWTEWFLSAGDSSAGWTGTWWTGWGNGDWFFFAGHNGRTADKIIVPKDFLDNLSVVTPEDILMPNNKES
jgi:hypothetical protein